MIPPFRKSRHRKRGFSLFEAVLVLAIGMGLIIGGIVYYQSAEGAARDRDSHTQILRILAGAAEMSVAKGYYDAFRMEDFIRGGYVTAGDDGVVRNPYGGAVEVLVDPILGLLQIGIIGITQEGCKRLAVSAKSGSIAMIDEVMINSPDLSSPDACVPGTANTFVLAKKVPTYTAMN